MLHDDFDGVHVRLGAVVDEKGGQEAAEGESGQHAQRVRQDGVSSRQNGVHLLVYRATRLFIQPSAAPIPIYREHRRPAAAFSAVFLLLSACQKDSRMCPPVQNRNSEARS